MRKIKKLLAAISLTVFTISFSFAQEADKKPDLYHPDANVIEDLAKAIQQAMAQNKNILLEIGGNWCKWCHAFNKFTTSDHEIDSTMNADYVVLHVNYSKENKNLPFLETLEYPQRFGFPVFVVLNQQGQRMHTQSSWYLEDGKDSYDKEKTIAFLQDWAPAALDPKKYEEKK
jgi:thiol:disulfide interchange protein